jgi:signal transduction histidine kinase
MRANHNHHDTATVAPDEQTERLQATILALQETNRRLEQELQDLTIELAATTDEFVRATEEVKRAKEEAERASTIKSAFLASMSHELRTPLNAVINFTRFVIDGDTGPVNEQQAELLTEVVNSARHLLNLINDVLDMSKIESGTLNLFVEEEVDVNTLLKSILTTGQSLLAGKPVRLEADIEQNLPLIRADRQRILQILLNIVSNACKFTEEGQITIHARREGDEIVIGVKDTGPGIAPEDQALVFEAFKQTSTGLRQGGGTGLGMPIAKNLAEAHGGRLWLTSVHGQGAEFYVAIPLQLDAARQVAALGGV